MILTPGPLKVMVATRPVDFRKGAVSLAALVENELGLKPFSGVAYIEVAQAELLALAEQSPVGPKAEKKPGKTTERASLPAHLPRIREVLMPVETECPRCGGAVRCTVR